MFNHEARQLVMYTRKKVEDLFKAFPVPAHNIDHTDRVTEWITKIAKAEHYDLMLAELAALLHDIGRVAEFQNNPEKLRHHELSYRLLQQWFEEDRYFDLLSAQEKDELLYAVRNHWDDAAEEQVLANILRDADKLDMYGKIGVQRAVEFHKIPKDISKNMKSNMESVKRIKTATAKQIVIKEKLLEPLKRWLQNYGS